MKMQRLLRRVVPSGARLTYHPVFKIAAGVGDIIPPLLFREFRRLPPNHLRIRVGVENRLFANQLDFHTRPIDFWLYTATHGYWNMQSTVLEIGVGVGRYAQTLSNYN